MEIGSILTLIVIVVAVYFFIKLVISPLLKAIIGVFAFLVILYLIQRIFNFDLNRIFGDYSAFIDITKWGINLNWLLDPLNKVINEFLAFFKMGVKNIPK